MSSAACEAPVIPPEEKLLHDLGDRPPVPPTEPDAAACCGEGCVRCVYDIYDEKLERYRDALERWRLRHP